MVQSAAAVHDLLQAPLTFMKNNLVIVMMGALSGVRSLTLDDGLGPCRTLTGRVINGYYLMPGDGGAASFDAFWCDYDQDRTRSVPLGPGPDLMFTARMAGCSLGIGSVVMGGTRHVSHTNKMTIGNTIADLLDGRGSSDMAQKIVSRSHQIYWQKIALQNRHAGDAGLQLVEPMAYRQDQRAPGQALTSTTFGIRGANPGEWAFYVQKCGDTGTHSMLVGVSFVGGDRPPQQAPVEPMGCVLF